MFTLIGSHVNVFFLFFTIFFSFSLTYDLGEEKLQTTSPLTVHYIFTPKTSWILLGMVATKVV